MKGKYFWLFQSRSVELSLRESSSEYLEANLMVSSEESDVKSKEDEDEDFD